MANELVENTGSLILKEGDRQIPVTFKPRARLLLQLGDQLIKNESIALIELIKNSYDADSSKVDVYMEKVDDPDNGTIIIEDNGFGMDLYTVENVWMEPGSDYKAEKFKNKEVTPTFKRLPIGEKGIGRFGVHKLGREIEMTTKKENSKEVFVKINWTDFDDYKYLEQVPISIIERENPVLFKNNTTGTSITIKKLWKKWERGLARDVKRSTNSLVSPFDSIDSFNANFEVFDKPGWFQDMLDWKDVKDYSLYNFEVTIENNVMTDFKYEFTPWASMPKLDGRIVDLNNQYIQEFQCMRLPDDVSKLGKIIFKGYIFDQDNFTMKLGVADKDGFKKYLKRNCGVRVFRDGLRVYDYGEPETDWLNLEFRRVNQPTKRLNKNILLGAVYLDRRDSTDLIEMTNREGFVENQAYSTLKNSVLHVIELIETLRYSDKAKLRELYGPTPKSEPVLQVLGDLKDYVDKNIKELEVKNEITKQLVKIETDYKRINETLLKAAGAGLSLSVVIHEVEKIIYEILKVLKTEKVSDRAMGLVKHLDSLIGGYSTIISKSAQSSEDVKEVIEQSLFNTEYRLSSHNVEVVKAYKSYTNTTKIKMARNLLIGSLMNIIDNSLFWLEKAGRSNKKLYIDISNDEPNYINIIIADNGTGFLLPTEEITEPFVSAKNGGMGLGLHIVSEIMIAQGGKLTFPNWGDFELPEEFKNGAVIALGFKK
jgi:signal transduction histidine kinase